MQAEGERLSLCEGVLAQERERPSRECRLKVSDSVFVKGVQGQERVSVLQVRMCPKVFRNF